MPRRSFLLVPEELQPLAESAGDYFEIRGYSVRPEPRDNLAYPLTPTYVGVREKTTLIVEVDSAIRPAMLDQWIGYGRSCGTDTRVAMVFSGRLELDGKTIAGLRARGVGVYSVVDGIIVEHAAPIDLAINMQLPSRESLDPKLRKALGEAYDHLDRANWREAFFSACRVVEREGRRYLAAGLRTGKITLAGKAGNPIVLTPAGIQKFTLGQLASHFEFIQAPNVRDSTIAKSLRMINPDRIAQAHNKPRAEQRLRRWVGRDMYVIIAALKALLDVKEPRRR